MRQQQRRYRGRIPFRDKPVVSSRCGGINLHLDRPFRARPSLHGDPPLGAQFTNAA
jgi:hypothetical protein